MLLLLAIACGPGATEPAEATTAGLDGVTVSATASPGMNQVLDALDSRERALDRREKSIDDREAELRAVEDELQVRVEELESLRGELQVLLDSGDTLRQERVRGLIKMTESMRSAQAAAFLDEMDRDLAVEVLDGMSRTKAGKALAAMDPERAAALVEAMTLTPLQRVQLD